MSQSSTTSSIRSSERGRQAVSSVQAARSTLPSRELPPAQTAIRNKAYHNAALAHSHRRAPLHIVRPALITVPVDVAPADADDYRAHFSVMYHTLTICQTSNSDMDQARAANARARAAAAFDQRSNAPFGAGLTIGLNAPMSRVKTLGELYTANFLQQGTPIAAAPANWPGQLRYPRFWKWLGAHDFALGQARNLDFPSDWALTNKQTEAVRKQYGVGWDERRRRSLVGTVNLLVQAATGQ